MHASRGRWKYYKHLALVNEELAEVFAGKVLRLIIETPPRHGKSELVSKHAPPCFLGNFPDKRVMLCSYEADFAASWGRKARDLLEEYGQELYGLKVSQESSAANRWDLEGHEGGMITAGIGGPITGKGFHLGMIDDYLKNAKEAASKTIRDAQWDWFTSTFYTRAEPGAAIIIIATRWHEDDLIGRLLNDMENGGEQWRIVRLPAEAEANDPIGRKIGEALCPARYNIEDLARIKRRLGSYFYSALYQQRPMPEEGVLFKRSYFRYFEDKGDVYVLHRPEGDLRWDKDRCWIFQTIDPAATEGLQSAYFVCATWAMTPERDLLLMDVFREKAETTKHMAVMKSQFERWRPRFQGVEKQVYGLNIIQQGKREGLPIKSLNADRDKVSRARPMAARYEMGTVYHRQGAAYLSDYEEELINFPNGEFKDQVDCAAYAGIQAYKESKTISRVVV